MNSIFEKVTYSLSPLTKLLERIATALEGIDTSLDAVARKMGAEIKGDE